MSSSGRKAYRVYLILSAASAFFFTLWSTVSSVYRVETAHLDPLQLVLVGTVLETSAFLFQVPTGLFADTYGRKRSIILGTVLIGSGFVLEGSLPVFGAILLAQAIWGIGDTFTTGATEAWIADEVGDDRAGQAYLRGAQAVQAASIVGAVASVALASIRLNVPMLLGGALTIVLGIALVFVMPEHGFRRSAEKVSPSWREMRALAGESGRLLRTRPVLLTILGIGVIAGMASEGVDRLSAAHFLLDIGLPPLGHLDPVVWFGILNVVTMGLSIVATEGMRRRVDTTSHAKMARLLLGVNVLLIVSVVAFGLAGNFALALATFWSLSLLRQVNQPLYTAWLNQGLEPRVRATVLSMSGLADAGGQIIGGPLVGLVGNLASIRAAIVVAGAALTPALALFARVLRQGGDVPGEHAAVATEQASAIVER